MHNKTVYYNVIDGTYTPWIHNTETIMARKRFTKITRPSPAPCMPSPRATYKITVCFFARHNSLYIDNIAKSRTDLRLAMIAPRPFECRGYFCPTT